MGLSHWASMEKKAWAQPHHQLSRRNPHARTHARNRFRGKYKQLQNGKNRYLSLKPIDPVRTSAGKRRVGRKNDRSMLVSDGWSIAKGGFRRYTINKHNWTLTTRQHGRDKSHDGQVRARWPRWRLSSDAAGTGAQANEKRTREMDTVGRLGNGRQQTPHPHQPIVIGRRFCVVLLLPVFRASVRAQRKELETRQNINIWTRLSRLIGLKARCRTNDGCNRRDNTKVKRTSFFVVAWERIVWKRKWMLCLSFNRHWCWQMSRQLFFPALLMLERFIMVY